MVSRFSTKMTLVCARSMLFYEKLSVVLVVVLVQESKALYFPSGQKIHQYNSRLQIAHSILGAARRPGFQSFYSVRLPNLLAVLGTGLYPAKFLPKAPDFLAGKLHPELYEYLSY